MGWDSPSAPVRTLVATAQKTLLDLPTSPVFSCAQTASGQLEAIAMALRGMENERERLTQAVSGWRGEGVAWRRGRGPRAGQGARGCTCCKLFIAPCTTRTG